VAAGYATRGSLDPILSLRLGTELPLWGGGRASRRQSAEHEALAAQQALRVASVEAGAEAGRLQAEVERSATLVQLYRDAVVPQSNLAFEAARAAYVSGSGTLARVVHELDRWLEARVELVRREAAHYVAATQLVALTNDASPALSPAPSPAPGSSGEGAR
jgi:outer membrane protein TolC